MTVDELKEYVIGKKYCTIAYDEYLGYRYLCTLTFISPHYVDAVKFQIISSNDSLPHHFCMDLFMASITVVY